MIDDEIEADHGNPAQVSQVPVQDGFEGMLGISFDTPDASRTAAALTGICAQMQGHGFIQNVFLQNPSQDNVVVISLSRSDDLKATAGSSLTIGEVPPAFQAVTSMTKVECFTGTGGVTRWTIQADGVMKDGAWLSMQSQSTNSLGNKPIAMLDMGTSFSLVPESIASAIYSTMPGAFFQNDMNKWAVPCSVPPPNISLIFGWALLLH